MNIEVIQNDIECGVAQNCAKCPVTRAVNRVLADGYWAESGTRLIVVVDPNGSSRSVKTPASAAAFIRDYDRAKEVEPFSFDLPLEQLINFPCLSK